MMDCQKYIDGSEGAYPEAKIKRIISECKNQNEVLRRVFGKFVVETGRVIGEFNPLTAYMQPRPVPHDWTFLVSGIDYGSGGTAHPAAFAFVAVSPDFKQGWVTDGWRGDDVDTTSGDIMEKWVAQRGARRIVITAYDWAAKDLATIAERMGISLVKAEKSHEIGEDALNTLFKSGMLNVFDTPELRKLGTECLVTMKETPKRKRTDDLIDAVRYAITQVPWDWTVAQAMEEKDAADAKAKKVWTDDDQARWEINQRRGENRGGPAEESSGDPMLDELEFWDQFYGNG